MRPFIVALTMLAVLATISTPVFIGKKMQLGDHAKSPQVATLSLGASALVAGGRARLSSVGGDGGDFEIENESDRRFVRPSIGEAYDACGVTVEYLGLSAAKPGKLPKAKYRITWK